MKLETKLEPSDPVREVLELARSKGLEVPANPAEVDERMLAQLLDELSPEQDLPPALMKSLDAVLAALEARDEAS